MLQVDDRIEIEAPRDAVFRRWAAVEQYPEFMTGVQFVHRETEVRLRWRVTLPGVEPTIYALVTEWVPDERLAWVSVDQHTMGWWIDLADAGPGRTAMTVRVIWSPRGDAPWPEGERGLDELTVRCDLQRFRTLVETAVPQAA